MSFYIDMVVYEIGFWFSCANMENRWGSDASGVISVEMMTYYCRYFNGLLCGEIKQKQTEKDMCGTQTCIWLAVDGAKFFNYRFWVFNFTWKRCNSLQTFCTHLNYLIAFAQVYSTVILWEHWAFNRDLYKLRVTPAFNPITLPDGRYLLI